MNTLRISFIAGLLSASSAYADTAPHWSTAIGTGRVSSSSPTATPSTATESTASGVPSPAHWTAFIGTGHVSQGDQSSPSKSATPGSVSAAASLDLEDQDRARIGVECPYPIVGGRYCASTAMTARRALNAFLGLLPFVLAACSDATSSADPRTQSPLVQVSTVERSVRTERSFTGSFQLVCRATSGFTFQEGAGTPGRYRPSGQCAASRSCASMPRTSGSRCAHGEEAVIAARARARQTADDEVRYRNLVSRSCGRLHRSMTRRGLPPNLQSRAQRGGSAG